VVGTSVNRGAPFVSASPEAEISRNIRELVSRLVPLNVPRSEAVAGVAGTGVRKRSRRFGFAKG
jgi:hypothetical protein